RSPGDTSDHPLSRTIDDFLRDNVDLANLSQPGSGFPVKILVASPPVFQTSSRLSYLLVDILLMIVLTAVATIMARLLMIEAGCREIADRRLVDAIAAMPAGFALFDANDRLAVLNDRYK